LYILGYFNEAELAEQLVNYFFKEQNGKKKKTASQSSVN